ncbi:MAG: site-specific integrase [Thermoleophilia bacterium]|nr:site-specific integrase [Thermoleophilia bacterium]
MPRRKTAPPPVQPTRRRRGSGSVSVRSDSRVVVTLPADLDPERRPLYSPPGTRTAWASVEQAARWLDAEVARRRNPAPERATGDEQLGAYLARWYRLYSPTWPERTATAYRQSLRLFAGIAAVRLSELTHEVVQGALARLQQATWRRTRKDGTPTGEPKPYSARTLQQARTALGLALEGLVPDVLAANPVRRTRLGRRQPPTQPVWDGAQAERFLAAAEATEPQHALALRLILHRGLRRGEVLALCWADLDERRAVLTVDETAGRRAGQTGDTKGRRSREIPLSRDLLARLAAHRAGRRRPTPWVFANPETGLPWSVETLRAAADRAIRAAGLPRISLKDMRATCATLLLDQGEPLPRVSELLGHADVSVTARAYQRVLRLTEARAADVAEGLDAAFVRAAGSGQTVEIRPSGTENGTPGRDQVSG